MVEDRGGVKAQLGVAEQVVAQLVLHGQRVGHAARAAEPVHPPQPRQAQAASAGPPDLLVQVALLAAEAPKTRMKSGPRGRPAAERAQPLHRYIERFAAG